MTQGVISLAGGIPRQDFIELGKFPTVLRSPGLAVVKNAGSPRNWKPNEGHGLDGATLTYLGANLSKFDVDIFCWMPAHFVEWEFFASLLLCKPLPLPAAGIALPEFALSIGHPILNARPWCIDKVVVEDVSSWEQNDVGLFSLTIKFIEYRKPVSVLRKAFEGPPGVNASVPAPVDPGEVLIAELQSKNATLGAKLR